MVFAPANVYTDTRTVRAAAPVDWEFKNFSLLAWDENALYESGASLDSLVNTGANSVTLVFTWYSDSKYSTDMYRTTGTASDASVVYAIRQAKARGLKVMLKPHLDPLDGAWRAYINPSDADAWFTNYRTRIIDHYADIAQQEGVIGMSIGAELVSMSTNATYTSRWRSLIADVRQRFGGKLTYSANWGDQGFNEEVAHVPFWDDLDYIGISAYYAMSLTNQTSVDAMKQRWAYWRTNRIDALHVQWNKPILFTEGGYRSRDGAAVEPWDNWSSGTVDNEEQQQCYEALFQTWAGVPWFAGGTFWLWNPRADVNSYDPIGYEVQNKPAYDTVKAYFGGRVNVTATPTATSTATPTAISTATSTAVPSATPTVTSTAKPTAASTATPTATMVPTATSTVTPTPLPAPGLTIRGVMSPSSSTGGGDTVTITGTNFQTGATVRFGGTTATAVRVVNSTTITAVTPPHAAGTVDVEVANPDGRTATMVGGLTFLPPGSDLPWVRRAEGTVLPVTPSAPVLPAPRRGDGSGPLSTPNPVPPSR